MRRLAGNALDEVRRSLMRSLADPLQKQALEHARFALLKNPWNLKHRERDELASLQRSNQPLYRAYLLEESRTEIPVTHSNVRRSANGGMPEGPEAAPLGRIARKNS